MPIDKIATSTTGGGKAKSHGHAKWPAGLFVPGELALEMKCANNKCARHSIALGACEARPKDRALKDRGHLAWICGTFYPASAVTC